MKNRGSMKKIMSVTLLGSVLVMGALAYADQLPVQGKGAQMNGAGPANRVEQRGGRESGMLTQLVTAGVITAEEQITIEKALVADHEAMKGSEATEKTRPVRGEIKVSPFAKLAENGSISTVLAEKIDAYMTKQRESAFAEKTQPLVDAGNFEDTDAVKTALDVVKAAMDLNVENNKPAAEREKVDFKSMTEAERVEFKATREAERTAMQAKREATLTEVFASLVNANTLTADQADALKAFMNDHHSEGRGANENRPAEMGFKGHPGQGMNNK